MVDAGPVGSIAQFQSLALAPHARLDKRQSPALLLGMLAITTAIERMLNLFPSIGTERVWLPDSGCRVLGTTLTAQFDRPAFNNSAMDGYAVRHSEVRSPSVALAVSHEIPAGIRQLQELPPNSAARIFTGAPLPPGADSVIAQEDAVRKGDSVVFTVVPRPGQHVRVRGSDVQNGAPLLSKGAIIGPGEIALLAAQGLTTLTVYRRPRVAIVSTGDELVEPHQAADPHGVVNSNAYALAAQVREAGGEPWVLPIARDNLKDIKGVLTEASRADAVLCTGGVSVGDYDFVSQAFDELGISTDFWKVAIKPGKPLRAASWHDTPIIGLPGNPVAAMTTFEIFVRPALRRMGGHSRLHRPVVHGVMADTYTRKAGRTEVARAAIIPATGAETGPPRIRLHRTQGSGALRSMVAVDALAIFPADCEHIEAGAPVTALLLNAAALAQPDQSPFAHG